MNHLKLASLYLSTSVLVYIFLFPNSTFAQQNSGLEKKVNLLSIDLDQMRNNLSAVPMEYTAAAVINPQDISLPMPDGSSRAFKVLESPILDSGVAAKYPSIKTYTVAAIDDPSMTGRISISPYGLNGVILSNQGMIVIRPLDVKNPILHEVSLNLMSEQDFTCDFKDLSEDKFKPDPSTLAIANGANKRTYDLAIVVTGEFYQVNGNTNALVTNAVTVSVNGIQTFFERDLAVGFNVLTPFLHTDPATDGLDPGGDRVGQAETEVAARFPGGYDFGHVFHTTNSGGSGIANLGVICAGNSSGGGWSGSSNNTTAGWFSLAGHEFGHMFNMEHTFNGIGSFCTDAISGSTAYEIGSGTTIMSYNGSCSAGQNIPGGGVADHYFHANSLDAAVTYMAGQNCHTTTNTGNNPPVVAVNECGGAYSIPIGTPFRLTRNATDANGDPIYYCWEQYDEDGADSPSQGQIGAAAANNNTNDPPLFRSYPPTTSPTRTFPNMDLVRTNQYTSDFEPLPNVARTLNFRLTARDWKIGGGGIDCQNLEVTVSANGPLTVASPNGGETLAAGGNTNVTWTVNGTNNICNSVNIRLSIDGGSTFPYTLAAGVANNGAATVAIPAGVVATTAARIMVESACNTCVVFFDISNADFTITSNCNAATSTICPALAMTLPAGDAGLNLGLNQYFGSTVSQFAYNVNNGSPTGPLANATTQGGVVCQTPWGTERYETIDFIVAESGIYNLGNNGNVFYAVFTTAGYNPANPCATTFLGSSSWGAGLQAFNPSSMSVNLTACTTYKLVIWTINGGTDNGNITISGAGQVSTATAGPGAGFAYTYVAVNTVNGQIATNSATANFTTLGGGSYNIHGASYSTALTPGNWTGMTLTQILSGGSCVLFSSNFKPLTVTGGVACTPPTITNVAIVQPPDCNNMTGSITVTANGQGTLEYTVNGANWVQTNVFNNLAPGNYNVVVRIQGQATCQTAYIQNPVTLNAPQGCNNCLTYNAGNLPIAIPESGEITSTINVTATGTLTDVNIKDLIGTHSWVEDLTFTITSPSNTPVVLFAGLCGNADDFNKTLDDQAVNAVDCPLDNGAIEMPQNPLSAFNGENPSGVWTLTINDGFDPDGGQLTGWTLELCGNLTTGNCQNNLALDTNPIPNMLHQAAVQITSKGTVTNGSNITFQAGNNIELQADITNQFEVQLGAIFEARIGACNQ